MNFNRKKTLEVVLILLSIAIFNPFIWTNKGVQDYAAVTLVLIWFYLSILNEYKLKNIAFRALISFSVSSVIMTAFFWNSEGRGYLLIYYIGIFAGMVGAFIFGFILAKIYGYFIKKNSYLNIHSKKILTITGIIFLVAISVFIGTKSVEQASSISEVQKKYEFGKRISRAIKNDELRIYDNRELIQSNIANGLYEMKDDKIRNGYGGEVSISKNNDFVSLTYSGIPAKDPCFDFYHINSLDIFGFKQAKVNGFEIKYNQNSAAEVDRVKKQACFSGENEVEIEFVGDINEIKKINGYFLR